MSIQIALIVSAPRELTLTAGRQEIEPSPEVEADESDLPFLNVGRAEGDEVHLSGVLIGDPDHLAACLDVSWFLPDEEGPDMAQPVDVSQAKVVINVAPRHRAEAGCRWHYRLESRKPYLETKFYDSGFLPPFKGSDLTIYLDHLINYNYDGYIISRIDYGHKPPSYVELDWSIPTLEAEGFLPD